MEIYISIFIYVGLLVCETEGACARNDLSRLVSSFMYVNVESFVGDFIM